MTPARAAAAKSTRSAAASPSRLLRHWLKIERNGVAYAGFDWETYLQFWEYARELRAEGKSILVVAHLVYDSTQLNTAYKLAGGVLECA